DQWPLSHDRLQIVKQLFDKQLQAGHMPSTSPWNTPIFTILKKSGKWHLLHDLRVINAIMQDMRALQPGLPPPVMIPKDWDLFIVDLKYCFFTIPLHPEDTEKFAFSIPAVNKQESANRFQWVVLPQGMKNSPTICQNFVAWVLQPFRQKYPFLFVYHFMNDILVAGENLEANQVLTDLKDMLDHKALKIAPEKIQQQSPWNYLIWQINGNMVRPQKVTIHTNIRTLTDVQKLMGDIQWVQPLTEMANDDLQPLMELL
ncbi:hypothetical protein N303_07899, partial [Cuculus canorus]